MGVSRRKAKGPTEGGYLAVLAMQTHFNGIATEPADGGEHAVWVWIEGFCEGWHSRHRRVHEGTRRCCCVKEKSKKHSKHEERVHAMDGCLGTVRGRQRGRQ